MPQVSVTINNKTYRMACDEGQESHLLALAEKVDGYIAKLKGSFGEMGDQRLTIMAGILITDELTELQKKIQGMENDLAGMRQARDDAIKLRDGAQQHLARALDQAAERIENLATKLTGE